jgi:tetratricopeptide (TPR) repeat protein
VVHGAVTAATGLAAMEPCRDERMLDALGLPPLEQREAIRAVRADVSRAGNLERAGRYAQGLELARGALARAQSLGWQPLVASARAQLGSLLDRSGDYSGAETMLEDAFFEAGVGVAPEVAVDAATSLVFVVGVRLGRPADAKRWSRHAEMALASIGDGEHLRRASLLDSLASVHDVMGDYEEAKALQQRALTIVESVNPEHPTVGSLLDSIAMAHASLGALDDAKRLEERAIDIHVTALGHEHPSVATSLANLAEVHRVARTYEEAKVLHERALVIFERALGPRHPDVALSLGGLALVHEAMGSHAQAAAVQERALDILEEVLGPAHRDVAHGLLNLANIRGAMGAYDEALPLYERALAIWEAALGPAHPHVAYALMGLAEVALAQGRPADAVAPARRAVSVRNDAQAPATEVAQARFLLARAWWEAPDGASRDRPGAVHEAEQARDAYREAGSSRADELVMVESWLAAHPHPTATTATE